MPSLNLTDLTVRALKGSDTTTYYWDATTPAFGVRVGKRAKTWTVIRGRSRERLTIGRYPAMSLTDARKEAKRLLSNEPEAKTVSMTFEKARDEFLETYKNPRTQYQVAASLKRHFRFGQLAGIEDTDIKRALDKLSDRPSEQLHAYRYLRTFFRWCVRPPRRYLKHSPMEGYEPPGTDKRGTRTLTDDELVAVWNASYLPRHAIFRVMMLFGTRNTETCVLERIWASAGVLTIPGEFTKNGRDHAIPIGLLAEHVLNHSQGNNAYYFSGRHGTGHITPGALGKLKREIMELSGTKGWQLRDLRRTFRSNMARLKVSREVAEVLINHAPPVLDSIYDRYDRIEEKREALAKYEVGLVWLLARV